MRRFRKLFHGGFYRSRRGIILGVCRGIAEYFDFSLFWTRIIAVLLLLISGFWPVGALYFIGAIDGVTGARPHLPPAMIARLLTCMALATAPLAGADDSPEAELATFRIAEGFEVNLFASEADGVVNPIQIRFDPRGRLWAIISTVYP